MLSQHQIFGIEPVTKKQPTENFQFRLAIRFPNLHEHFVLRNAYKHRNLLERRRIFPIQKSWCPSQNQSYCGLGSRLAKFPSKREQIKAVKTVNFEPPSSPPSCRYCRMAPRANRCVVSGGGDTIPLPSRSGARLAQL